MYVNLSKLPSPKPQYQILINDFSGGVNQRRSSAEIANNQCSQMVNMLWENGILKQRPGQCEVVLDVGDEFKTQFERPIAVYERSLNNKILFAYRDIELNVAIAYCAICDGEQPAITTISRIPRDSDNFAFDAPGKDCGSFFDFGGSIYFKGKGIYKKITVSDDGNFSSEDVVPYIPIIQINTDPLTGVGDLYQSENRLSEQKEVWFNAKSGVKDVEFVCDGATTVFHLPHKSTDVSQCLVSVDEVYIGAALGVENEDYAVDLENGTIAFQESPALGQKIIALISVNQNEYTLPVVLNPREGDDIVDVLVKNLETGLYESYFPSVEGAVAEGKGYIWFNAASKGGTIIRFDRNIVLWNGKPLTDPNVLNSFVKVRYTKRNEDAVRSIDECCISSTYGSTGVETNCVVLAGSESQPNAYFWSGNDSAGANPGYFPITHYNLAGEYCDPIVAFGRQQNKLVIFQNNRIGSATFSLDEVDGRMVVSLPYMTINDAHGCDLPTSIQLIENNLVWAHTKHGVLYLKDSTYAYETLVAGISGNINQSLLDILRNVDPRRVSSIDDGKRYWLFCDSSAFVWDYAIQGYTSNTEKLSWFPMSRMAITHTASVKLSDGWFRLSRDGTLFLLTDKSTLDFEETINGHIRTKDFNFGTYAYRKNVEKIIFVFPNTNVKARVTYESDLQAREEILDLIGSQSGIESYANPVRVRTPKCRHVHSFAVSLSSVDSAPLEIKTLQIFYTFTGTQSVRAGQRM